jgi:type I restriction enzyme S subunit
MKRYETNKPSGIEWLGDIPEHWEVRRVKDLFTVNPNFTKKNFDKNKQVSFTPMECLRCGQIEKRTIDFATAISYVPFKNNDILMAKVTPCFENGNIAIADDLENGIGFGSSEIYVIRSNEKYINRKLAFYLFQSNYFRSIGISNMKGTGGLKRVDSISLNTVSFPIISLQEQTILANYLDAKTTAIDRKIELLTAKADKYKALRRSLINETVCRGLNPKIPQKDSGIEWIGMIPEHWSINRMKDIGFLYSGLSGKAGDDFNQDENENNRNFIPFTNIFNNDTINPDVMGKVVVFKNEKQNKVRKGDLFFLMSSEDYDGLGKTSLLTIDLKETFLNSFCKGFRITKKNVVPAFLNYQLQADTFRKVLQIEGKGFTRMNLKSEKVTDFKVFVPKTTIEQIEIVNFLNKKTAQIDTILTNIGEQINKLTQLRKTLINDVVTGKIKVTED